MDVVYALWGWFFTDTYVGYILVGIYVGANVWRYLTGATAKEEAEAREEREYYANLTHCKACGNPLGQVGAKKCAACGEWQDPDDAYFAKRRETGMTDEQMRR